MKVFVFGIVALFVVIWQLMSNYELIRFKNPSHHLQLNCIISCFFQLHLMLHACVRRFDVTGIVGNFFRTKQGLNVLFTAILY